MVRGFHGGLWAVITPRSPSIVSGQWPFVSYVRGISVTRNLWLYPTQLVFAPVMAASAWLAEYGLAAVEMRTRAEHAPRRREQNNMHKTQSLLLCWHQVIALIISVALLCGFCPIERLRAASKQM